MNSGNPTNDDDWFCPVHARSQKVNMAEGIDVELDEDDEGLQRAVKVNGRYVDPWGTARMPSKVDVLRWKLLEKNERGIGGTWKELFRFKHEVN